MTFDVLKKSKTNIPTEDELRQIEEMERDHNISSSLSQFDYIENLKEGFTNHNRSIFGSSSLGGRR